MRSWARGKLPQKILDRPKKGFSIPLTHWLSGPPCLHLTVGQFLAGKNDHNRINKPSKELILQDFRRFLLPIMAFGSQHLDKTKCYDKTFPVEYTPKPLNNKASPVFDLSSQKLSNSKLSSWVIETVTETTLKEIGLNTELAFKIRNSHLQKKRDYRKELWTLAILCYWWSRRYQFPLINLEAPCINLLSIVLVNTAFTWAVPHQHRHLFCLFFTLWRH